MPQLRKILVATDLSRKASHAVERAALLALDHHAAVRLVHAHRSFPADTLARVGIRQQTAAKVDAALRARLESEAGALRGRGIDVSAQVGRGGPLSAIRQALELFSAELVVVGAQGQRSLRNVVLGTTAQRLLDYVPRDILAVARPPRGAYSSVLVCVDADLSAAPVLTAAAALFPTAQFHIVHAYEPLFEGKLRFAHASETVIRQHRKESRKEAERSISDVIRRSQIDVSPRSLIVRRGYPPDVILKVARRRKVDLIVLGRARTAVSEVFLGSVSKQVLQQAGCDIAVLGRNVP